MASEQDEVSAWPADLVKWDELGPSAQEFIVSIAFLLRDGVDARIRFQAHNGGVRDVRAEVDLSKAYVLRRKQTIMEQRS